MGGNTKNTPPLMNSRTMKLKNSHIMKKICLCIMALSLTAAMNARGAAATMEAAGTEAAQEDSVFRGRIENDEYQVYIVMDFYKRDVVCPRQEIFGGNPGYFGARRDTRKWIIEDADVKGRTARLVIINDYGSEDLDARLTYDGHGEYTLERTGGSAIKIVVDRKWVKIPKKLTFKAAKK